MYLSVNKKTTAVPGAGSRMKGTGLAVGVLLSVVFAGLPRLQAQPAPHVAAALDSHRPAFHQRGNIHQAAQMLLTPFIKGTEKQVRLLLEYDGAYPAEYLQVDLAPASLREQLDAATATFGYTWRTFGDWVAVTPRASREKEDWFPAEKVGSRMAVSYARSCESLAQAEQALTLQAALAARQVRFASRSAMVLRTPGSEWLSVKAPDPQILNDPSWREAVLTRRAQAGFNVIQWQVMPQNTRTGELVIWETVQTVQPLSSKKVAAEQGQSVAEPGG